MRLRLVHGVGLRNVQFNGTRRPLPLASLKTQFESFALRAPFGRAKSEARVT
jgi:hypothetical protein